MIGHRLQGQRKKTEGLEKRTGLRRRQFNNHSTNTILGAATNVQSAAVFFPLIVSLHTRRRCGERGRYSRRLPRSSSPLQSRPLPFSLYGDSAGVSEFLARTSSLRTPNNSPCKASLGNPEGVSSPPLPPRLEAPW